MLRGPWMLRLVIALLVSIATVATPWTASVSANHAPDAGRRLWIYPGLDTQGHAIWNTQGWHYDNNSPPGDAWALDLGRLESSCGGCRVSVDTASNYGLVFAWAQPYDVPGSHCRGVVVSLWDNSRSGEYLGTVKYSHIDSATQGMGWTIGSGSDSRYVGNVAWSQPSSCPWTGPHVHQAGGPYWTGHWGDRDPYPDQAWAWEYWMQEVRY